MRICMVGLGSIGQRHLKNAGHVLAARGLSVTVDALRVKGKALSDECGAMISEIYPSPEALPDGYDVIFITNPTVFHYDTVRKLVSKTRHLFVEKPVFEEYKAIDGIGLTEHGVYYVACPLRHKKVIQYVKALVEKGEKFNSVRAISSSYLPDWRKGADYRNVYSAKRELGGGVELDLIHEWDYIRYLFGIPEKMFKFVGKYSDLEIDSDDTAIYIARYADKTLELHLDYFGTENVRILELMGNKKKYGVDINHNRMKVVEDGKATQLIEFGEDNFYLSEMEYFFDVIGAGKKSFNEIPEANELLRFVLEEAH